MVRSTSRIPVSRIRKRCSPLVRSRNTLDNPEALTPEQHVVRELASAAEVDTVRLRQ
jgi:hypothetical protein